MVGNLTHDGIRKAAILVASLDTAAADAVLDQLTPEQARQVREIVIELDDVDQGEQRRVIDEFFHNPGAAGATHVENESGVELDGRLAWLASHGDTEQAGSTEQGAWSPVSPLPAPRSLPAGKPFRFLHEAEADKLVRAPRKRASADDRAGVVAHGAPAKSGAVLARLPESVQ